MSKTSEIATKTEQVELSSPSDILGFANNLKEMIVQNRLYTDIKGKKYVNVEGWQIAGAFTGTFPVVEKVEDLSDGTSKHYKYRAEVSLCDKDGNKVGYGVAICTNQEAGKQNFDEYAVASMAQTRAVGKAYRMKIGWLLKVAGYETTPAEEMDAVAAEVVDERPRNNVSFAEVREKLTEIDTTDKLNAYWKELGLSDKQANVLKVDFAKRKAQLGEA